MKYFIAIFVFSVTVGLSMQSTAGAGAGHNDLVKQMNSLFPEKQQLKKATARPAVVELTEPRFLAKISGPTRLEWKEAPGANVYHVQVATDPNFKWLVANEHFVKINSFEFAKPAAGNKYFWRVAAYNTNNDSGYNKSNFTSSVFVAK